ncbi:MAG: hypothetical protein NVSMB42_13300 [Herpetosiphon sp.]
MGASRMRHSIHGGRRYINRKLDTYSGRSGNNGIRRNSNDAPCVVDCQWNDHSQCNCKCHKQCHGNDANHHRRDLNQLSDSRNDGNRNNADCDRQSNS